MRLDIKDLNVAYETTKVLKNLSLCVKEGEFFTILGHSGSGKSTILKAVAGLIDSRGTVTLGDVDISQLAPEERNIAYVFQKPLLFPHLSVSKNIAFGLEIHKWSKSDISARVNELLELLFIKDLGDRMPNELSGGQQQRVAIARALALNPSIILMDEPFSSLDPELRSDLGELLKSIQQKLMLTIVFVTHDSYEALRLSDTIAFLEDGVVLQEGNSEELFSRPKTRVVGDFFGKGNYITKEMSDIQLVENNQLLYIRPHDIEVREVEGDLGHNEVIISHGVLAQVHKIGKECRLTFNVKGGTIFVEYFGSKVFNIEANYNLVVNSNKLHYI